MLLLGLDTATAVTTVGLVRSASDGTHEILGERSHRDPRRHGEVLPVLIGEVLRASGAAPSDLGTIAVGVGPGAYTGLRVGLATAHALGLALQIPVHGMSTLDLLAFDTHRTEPFAIVTDARRREHFWATYSRFDQARSDPTVGTPDAARVALAGLDVVCPPGTPAIDGLAMYQGADPSAAALCEVVLHRLEAGLGTGAPTACYLRSPDVMPASTPKSVLS
ncbi:MAG: tRNA (adenosine(37)-N6)-threonylcarbamoyltransferase complex dimerization subunit type 1 TsaB [Actinomycetes bacterium]